MHNYAEIICKAAETLNRQMLLCVPKGNKNGGASNYQTRVFSRPMILQEI